MQSRGRACMVLSAVRMIRDPLRKFGSEKQDGHEVMGGGIIAPYNPPLLIRADGPLQRSLLPARECNSTTLPSEMTQRDEGLFQSRSRRSRKDFYPLLCFVPPIREMPLEHCNCPVALCVCHLSCECMFLCVCRQYIASNNPGQRRTFLVSGRCKGSKVL